MYGIFPKLEEVQAEVQKVKDTEAERQRRLEEKKVRECLPQLQDILADKMRAAAKEGYSGTVLAPENYDIPETPSRALQMLADELAQMGYTTEVEGYPQRLTVKWDKPQQDKLEISFKLGGQFRDKEEKIKELIRFALSQYHDSNTHYPEHDLLLATIRQNLK